MIKKQILLIGGGGHCKSVIDVIESKDEFKIVGIIDTPEKVGSSVLEYSIIGSDTDLNNFISYKYAFITLGHIKNPAIRIKLFDEAKQIGYTLPVIISNMAYASDYSTIQEGTVIMHQSILNAGVKIGKNCIINTGALIEHDCKIGDHTHISTSAVLNGDVFIGSRCFIGSSCTIFNSVSICSDVILGAGSVVTKNIEEPGIYFGNPAKKIK